MKKIITLILLGSIISCSSSDDSDSSPLTEENYFDISDNEEKVNNYKVVYTGEFDVIFKIYKARLNDNDLEVRGDLIANDTINVSGEYILERNEGFEIYEDSIINYTSEGQINVIVNGNFQYHGPFFIDELSGNQIHGFLIPFKYEID